MLVCGRRLGLWWTSVRVAPLSQRTAITRTTGDASVTHSRSLTRLLYRTPRCFTGNSAATRACWTPETSLAPSTPSSSPGERRRRGMLRPSVDRAGMNPRRRSLARMSVTSHPAGNIRRSRSAVGDLKTRPCQPSPRELAPTIMLRLYRSVDANVSMGTMDIWCSKVMLFIEQDSPSRSCLCGCFTGNIFGNTSTTCGCPGRAHWTSMFARPVTHLDTE